MVHRWNSGRGQKPGSGLEALRYSCSGPGNIMGAQNGGR